MKVRPLALAVPRRDYLFPETCRALNVGARSLWQRSRCRTLVLLEVECLFCNPLGRDDDYLDGVARVYVALACRNKSFFGNLRRKLWCQLWLGIEAILVADDVVQEGDDVALATARSRIRYTLERTNGIIRIHNTVAVDVNAGEQVECVVGKEAFVIKRVGQHLRQGRRSH